MRRRHAFDIVGDIDFPTLNPVSIQDLHQNLILPLSLLMRGRRDYIVHHLIWFTVIGLLTALLEVMFVQKFDLLASLIDLPFGIEPFLGLGFVLALRFIEFPILLAVLVVPVRVLFFHGSLDLSRLLEATPQAIMRSLLTSWMLGRRLFRRGILVLLLTWCAMAVTSSLVPSSLICIGVSILTGAYLFARLPLLCAPVVSILGDYEKRYAMRQTCEILRSSGHAIRLIIISTLGAIVVTHRILKSLLYMTQIPLAPTILWINSSIWLWFGTNVLASLVLSQAYEFERRAIGGKG